MQLGRVVTTVFAAAPDAGARPWIWAVAAGLALGGVLIGHSIRQVFRALPDDTQATALATVRRHPRLLSVAGAVVAWTTVYALYSLAYPTSSIALSGATAQEDLVGGGRRTPTTVTAGDVIGALDDRFFGDDGRASGGARDGDDPSTPTDDGSASPPATSAPRPAPAAACSVEAQANAVRQAQVAAEQLTGRPLGADGGAFVEALAGCKDPTNTALSLLTPIDALLRDAGFTGPLPLPDVPGLSPVPIPEAIAAPLRGPVFQVCGQVLRQLYTAAAVAPTIRISYDDAVRIVDSVSAVCSSFARAS